MTTRIGTAVKFLPAFVLDDFPDSAVPNALSILSASFLVTAFS